MEHKINIAELLKDCPKGMELDCTMFEGLEFDCINAEGISTPICCRIKNPNGGYNGYNFTKYGCWSNLEYAKCVIFPKGKTTWEGFQRPFKDGDIIASTQGDIAIYKGIHNYFKDKHADFYVGISNGLLLIKNYDYQNWGKINNLLLATEEEKAKLFQTIKDNGYKWNPETKTLEKLVEPKFKVGDTIQHEDGYKVKITEVNVEDECYEYESLIAKGIGSIAFSEQGNWELVPNKFDITTLKPFDKVLVRDNDKQNWVISFFSHCNGLKFYKYSCINGCGCAYCIPYEDNQHLLGTTNDCDEYYKTWE